MDRVCCWEPQSGMVVVLYQWHVRNSRHFIYAGRRERTRMVLYYGMGIPHLNTRHILIALGGPLETCVLQVVLRRHDYTRYSAICSISTITTLCSLAGWLRCLSDLTRLLSQFEADIVFPFPCAISGFLTVLCAGDLIRASNCRPLLSSSIA